MKQPTPAPTLTPGLSKSPTSVPADSDPRWLLERRDTPWYGSARLYRQAQSWDWSDVFTEVARDLATLVAERTPSITSHSA